MKILFAAKSENIIADLKNAVIFAPPLKTSLGKSGSIAQLVQSTCLTSRGSGVRIPLLPQGFRG